MARHPRQHQAWFFWPVRHATLLGAVVVALIAIVVYFAVSQAFTRLREHGPVVLFAGLIGGVGCAFVVFAAERSPGHRDYSGLLSTAGQITAAIRIAFVIDRRFTPGSGREATRTRATDLDIIGFAFIVTGMGVAVLGSYPVGTTWQAALGVVSCMGAGAGIATLAYRVSEL